LSVQKVVKSPLVEALEARKRELHPTALPFLSGGSVKGTVAFRVPTAEEEFFAQAQAAQYASSVGQHMEPWQLEEIDLSSVWLLHKAYVLTKAADAKRPDILEPAFMPRDIIRLFTPDQIGMMIDEIEDARARASGAEWDEEEVEGLRATLSVVGPEHAVDLLASKPRSWLVRFAAFCCGDHAVPAEAGPDFQFVAMQ
jgi:hypothetical protein